MVKRGFYRHYKGGLYYVIGIGKHSETKEEMVLYFSLHFREYWVRPSEMWTDEVERPSINPRFPNPVLTDRFRPVSIWYVLRHIWTKPVIK